MKKSSTSVLFVAIRLISDILVIQLSIILAYSVKFKVGWIFKHYFQLNWGQIYSHAQIEPYLKSSGLLIAIWILTFAFSGLYRSKNTLFPVVDEWISIVKASTISIIQIMAITIIYTDFPDSRFVILYTWLFGIVLLAMSRLSIMRAELRLAKTGIGSKKTLIVGTGQTGQDIAEKLFLFPTLKLFYVGHIGHGTPSQLHFHLRKKFKLIGNIDDASTVIRDLGVNVVFITQLDEPYDNKKLNALITFCKANRIDCYILPNLFRLNRLPVISADFDGLTFLRVLLPPKKAIEQVIKRGMDLILSACLLLVCAPIFGLVYVLIKSVSPGPVFYVQTRTTLNNRPFGMIKFRTMDVNAEANGPVMVNETHEPRYIRFGEFLRKTSIDELPQLLNVLKGDMSIVGPRPERPFFNEQFEKEIPGFLERTQVKGGITGWAQINGRSVLTRRPEHKLKYDLYYIHHWSLLFDINILLKTIFVVFKSEEAY